MHVLSDLVRLPGRLPTCDASMDPCCSALAVSLTTLSAQCISFADLYYDFAISVGRTKVKFMLSVI